MSYPMKEICNPFTGAVNYREMTSEEYLHQLDWYREYIERDDGTSSRHVQEYVDYLKRWFSDQRCDGLDNYETRFRMHKLPMSYNIYFN